MTKLFVTFPLIQLPVLLARHSLMLFVPYILKSRFVALPKHVPTGLVVSFRLLRARVTQFESDVLIEWLAP